TNARRSATRAHFRRTRLVTIRMPPASSVRPETNEPASISGVPTAVPAWATLLKAKTTSPSPAKRRAAAVALAGTRIRRFLILSLRFATNALGKRRRSPSPRHESRQGWQMPRLGAAKRRREDNTVTCVLVTQEAVPISAHVGK